MSTDPDDVPRHESVDHEHPTVAGMEGDDEHHVPGTGIMGDETLVRDHPGGLHLPLSRAPSHHSSRPHPGPTPAPAMDEAGEAGR